MTEAAPTTAPAGETVDLKHLDGTLTNLHQAKRDIATMASYLAEGLDRITAAPDDAEARRAVRMAELRMRGDAFVLAQHFAALAQPEGSAL